MGLEIKYGAGVVRYDELQNLWLAIVDDVQVTPRGVSSLAAAKKVLDDQAKGEKEHKAKFERLNAWRIRYSQPPTKVEVTSITELPGTWHNEREAWILTPAENERGKPKREKVRLSELREWSPGNGLLVDDIVRATRGFSAPADVFPPGGQAFQPQAERSARGHPLFARRPGRRSLDVETD